MLQRIIAIRESKNLNQEQFATKIGVSRNFISLVENGKRNLSDRTISDICRIFNVSEEWLRTGAGGDEAMFLPNPKSIIEEFAQKLKLTTRDRILIEKFLALPDEGRQAVMDYALSVAEAVQMNDVETYGNKAKELAEKERISEKKPDAPASSASEFVAV